MGGIAVSSKRRRIRLYRASHVPPINTSSSPTLQINVPSVQYPTIPPSAPEFTVSIHSIGSSGITGTVTFKDIAGTVAILLHVDGLPADEESEESIMPVELHYGTCTALGPLRIRCLLQTLENQKPTFPSI